MITVEQLFQDHTSQKVLHQMLVAALEEATALQRCCQADPTAEIEALSLKRAPLSDLPRSPQFSNASPTEQVARRIDAIIAGVDIREKEKQLQEVEHCLKLHAILMNLFDAKEQWFIQQYFDEIQELDYSTELILL